MPSTPTSALPDATEEGGETLTFARRASAQAGRLAELARDNPRTAIAAGAAMAAGVAAAAAIPLVRAARRNSGNGAATPGTETAAAKPQARKRAPARKSARSAKKS